MNSSRSQIIAVLSLGLPVVGGANAAVQLEPVLCLA